MSSLDAISLLSSVALALALYLLYTICLVVYRLFFHPLRSFPGPKLAAATFAYEIYFDVFVAPGGQFSFQLDHLHDIYGPVVRVNPEEIHVRNSDFFDVLYAGPGHVRDKGVRSNRANGSPGSVASTLPHDHHRLRRSALNPFFSKRAVTQLESSVRDKVDLLCQKIRSAAEGDKIVDIGSALTALTVDVITEYCFDQSYNALEDSDLGVSWKRRMTGLFQGVPVVKHFPVINTIMQALPLSLIRKLVPDMAGLLEAKSVTDAQSMRIWQEFQPTKLDVTDTGERPRTIFHGILSSKLPAHEKTAKRLADEAFVLVVAGGETTARVSTVILARVLQNPNLLRRLRAELEGVTKDGLPGCRVLEELPLLKATVQEGVRTAGVITNKPVFIAPDEDLSCEGWVIPRGTPTSMSARNVLLDPVIFPEPRLFNPERWLQAAERGERLDKYLVTFSKGTRQCAGMNLAYSEMYLGIAALITRFDMELHDFDYERDLEIKRDCFVGFPGKEAKDVRIKVRPRVR